jgi:hypothetical protein
MLKGFVIGREARARRGRRASKSNWQMPQFITITGSVGWQANRRPTSCCVHLRKACKAC